MKKSNKLLLGGFLAGLLLVSAIHIALYAKYKRGDYSTYDANTERRSSSMQLYPNIVFVSLRDVPNAAVTFGGDTAGVDKAKHEDIRVVQRGDSLLISGTDEDAVGGDGYPLAVQLPGNVRLSAYGSTLSIDAEKNTSAANPALYLNRSRAVFVGQRNPLQFGQLTVVATDSSAALFREPTQVDRLEVSLSRSTFEYTDGNTGQVFISTDSISRISLPAKQLLKATITYKQ